jgi:hypothetical protein
VPTFFPFTVRTRGAFGTGLPAESIRRTEMAVPTRLPVRVVSLLN